MVSLSVFLLNGIGPSEVYPVSVILSSLLVFMGSSDGFMCSLKSNLACIFSSPCFICDSMPLLLSFSVVFLPVALGSISFIR